MKHRVFAGIICAAACLALGAGEPEALGAEALLEQGSLSVAPDFDMGSDYGRKMLQKLILKNIDQENDSLIPISLVAMGEVKFPGEYEIPGKVDVIKAIVAAGGPNDSGSLRNVEILRNDKIVALVDLYEFFARGRFAKDFKFLGGEVINIPLVGPMIAVSGQVKSPGIFELKKKEMFLDKALKLCGGITPSEYGIRLEILRQIGGLRRVFLAFEIDPKENVPPAELMSGDEIVVSKVIARKPFVSLEGFCEARKVPFKDGMRLSEFLTDSQLKPDAALEYAEILRDNGKDVYDVIGFSPEAIMSRLENDIGLRAGDRVVVFSHDFLKKNPVVFVEGAVNQPGKFMLTGTTDVVKVIAMSGGLPKNGKNMAAELSRREIINGRLKFSRIEINLAAALKDDPRHNLLLKPFDSLRIFEF